MVDMNGRPEWTARSLGRDSWMCEYVMLNVAVIAVGYSKG